MSDFPALRQALPLIGTYSEWGIGVDAANSEAGVSITASTAWSLANRAIYVPFAIPFPFWVRKIWWCNGTAVNGNVDCGVVDNDGTPIFTTGSTAQANASVLQAANPTQGAGILLPGSYYFAISNSGTTGTFSGFLPNTRHGQMLGIQQAATQLPLAASPTFATFAGAIVVPFCGIASVTTL